MNVIKKITKNSVSHQVYHQLKENIIKGVWQPGEKIPSENKLVTLFGVSRASVRMAIQKMIAYGLLESKAGNGTFVKEFKPDIYFNELISFSLNPEDQLEIMEFRKALETEAIRLAAERNTEQDIAELEAIHFRAREAFKQKDLDTYFKEDLQFHSQIFKMSKNSIFITVFQTLGDILFSHFYSVAKDFFDTSNVPSDEADLHTIIVNGLKMKDAKTCVRAYTRLTQELIAMYRELKKKETGNYS